MGFWRNFYNEYLKISHLDLKYFRLLKRKEFLCH